MHPQPRFEVNLGCWGIASPGFDIGHVVDDLHVGYAIEKEIFLRLESAIGHAAEGALKVNFSVVRLSSRTLLLGKVGGVGVTGTGNVVPSALLGRKMILKPVPQKGFASVISAVGEALQRSQGRRCENSRGSGSVERLRLLLEPGVL